MHGARLVGYPVYYMSRAPAAPDIGTQHLKIPNVCDTSIPVDAQEETRGVRNRESTGIGHT